MFLCPRCKQPLDPGRICGACRKRWCICQRPTKSGMDEACVKCEREMASRKTGWERRHGND